MRFYLIGLLLLFGCNSSESEISNVDEVFGLESFKRKEVLNASKLDLGTVLAPVDIFTYDSLLFVSSSGLSSNISVYNRKNSYKHIGAIIGFGSGPEEMLSVARMDFDTSGFFWAQDVVGHQMKRYQLTGDGGVISARVTQQVSMRGSVMTAVVIGNRKVVTTTHDINPLTRFYEYDLDGVRTGTTGAYPAYEREIPPTAAVEVYTAYVAPHGDGEKFLLAYEYLDLLEIYDADSKLVKRIHGPHRFLPEFDLGYRGDHPYMQRKFNKTRTAYVSVVANNDEIFLLYGNGRSRSKEEGEAGIHHRHVVTVDWNGNPLAYYELDHAVASICVDAKERIIYGLDRIESEVYAFRY